SRHYSLNFLGLKFPEFLDGPLKIKHRAVLADVARVERAITQIMDEPEAEKLEPKAIEALPPESWAGARLALAPATRLLALDHRANALVTALRQEKPLPDLGRVKTWVIAYRKEWVAWRMDLPQAAYEMLCALQAGATLAEAIEKGGAVWEGTPDE